MPPRATLSPPRLFAPPTTSFQITQITLSTPPYRSTLNSPILPIEEIVWSIRFAGVFKDPPRGDGVPEVLETLEHILLGCNGFDFMEITEWNLVQNLERDIELGAAR